MKYFIPSAWLLAQETHMLLGILALIFSKAYGLPLWEGATAILIFALLKETLFDPYVEGKPFFWSGAVDLFFYGIGVVIAYVLIFVLALI